MSAPRIAVVGSANVDLVARCARLPRPGETVTDAVFERVPGGKGANQALAAARLGARVRFVGRDGRELARAAPPPVVAVDGTAAGDAFCAALMVSLLEGRDHGGALRRACAAGALAASRPGAQPSLPTGAEIDAVLAG